MTAHFEQLKQAYFSGLPFAIDRATERLASEGVPIQDLYESLGYLLVAIRSSGATNDEEERVLGAMDRLSGWCHPSNRIGGQVVGKAVQRMGQTQHPIEVQTSPNSAPSHS